MNGCQGIAPDGTRLILCGISYKQVISCAGMSQKEAAKRLGVNYTYFNQVVKRLGLSHWYTVPKRHRRLTAAKIRKLAAEGYHQKDAASVAGVSYSCFNDTVKAYGLQDLFPNCGSASWISRRGYVK